MICRRAEDVRHAGRRGAWGFTLLEVVVASAVFSFSMLALIPLLVSSYHVDTETLYRVRAQHAAAQRLDELLSHENLVQGIVSAVTNTDYIDAHTGMVSNAPPPVPVVITRTWTVGPPRPFSHLCSVAVTSSYMYKKSTKTYQVQSLKGR